MSVSFYGCITMDGYLADKTHNLDWLYQTGGTEETSYDRFYQNMDITIMGKRTFQAIEKEENMETLYPTTQNYVFTHSGKLPQKGFTAVNADIVEFVKQIDPDKNIWIIGGNTILAPLLNHDMVDSVILQIAPVLLGDGIPLFTQNEALKRFRLQEVRKYGQFAELVFEKPGGTASV